MAPGESEEQSWRKAMGMEREWISSGWAADGGEGTGPPLARVAPWCILEKDTPLGGDHPTPRA